MKFVHAADIHLDSPLRGLERYAGAPSEGIRGATRRALEQLVALCLEERADFLLIAGDLYDGGWKDYNTGLFFLSQMNRLREAGIPVALIRGNHDAASQITKHLPLPDHVHELSYRRPDTLLFEKIGVAIHGQGYEKKATTDDLASRYPKARSDLFNVGLLHTCAEGREGHESYAPCSLPTLLGKGYDYWALGHVHQREVLCEDPFVVFPGNLQGRHVKESGAKGATLVTVEEGRIVKIEHRPLDVVRWGICRVDIGEAPTADDAIDLARRSIEQKVAEADGRLLATRILLTGRTPAHVALSSHPEHYRNEIRAAAADAAGDGVWVEQVLLSTQAPIDMEALRQRDDAIGQLARSLHALRSDPEALTSLARELADLRHKLPLELLQGTDALTLESPSELAAAIDDVEQILIPRLLYDELGR